MLENVRGAADAAEDGSEVRRCHLIIIRLYGGCMVVLNVPSHHKAETEALTMITNMTNIFNDMAGLAVGEPVV
jgi:hypothetical protein